MRQSSSAEVARLAEIGAKAGTRSDPVRPQERDPRLAELWGRVEALAAEGGQHRNVQPHGANSAKPFRKRFGLEVSFEVVVDVIVEVEACRAIQSLVGDVESSAQ